MLFAFQEGIHFVDLVALLSVLVISIIGSNETIIGSHNENIGK